ncbi:MAG TPA: SsrA-binding protein SmpB [Candidatus Paceibacterota bacterium]|nr:SsrA-binding protein SmpB [Candidatus Paceibacterota bacterium]
MTEYVKNRKASFDYEYLEQYEAGIVLSGFEVKAIRAAKASLNGAYVIIRGGEAFLVNASITPYQPANMPKNYDPERARKLLLSKKELAVLEQGSEKQGLTIVALKWYNKNRKIKLSLALAKGKKKADKREKLKEKSSKRDIERLLKNQ